MGLLIGYYVGKKVNTLLSPGVGKATLDFHNLQDWLKITFILFNNEGLKMEDESALKWVILDPNGINKMATSMQYGNAF